MSSDKHTHGLNGHLGTVAVTGYPSQRKALDYSHMLQVWVLGRPLRVYGHTCGSVRLYLGTVVL